MKPRGGAPRSGLKPPRIINFEKLAILLTRAVAWQRSNGRMTFL